MSGRSRSKPRRLQRKYRRMQSVSIKRERRFSFWESCFGRVERSGQSLGRVVVLAVEGGMGLGLC